jgi:2-keto-3-deoxy-L-rhamnonate aldolase RhmA
MTRFGTFFEMGGRGAMECLTRTGLDFVVIDTEHGCFSEETVADYIVAAERGNLLPLVRIGDIRRPYVLRMLDIGARGLIIPNIHGVDEVRTVVDHAKFPPVGNRGFCPNRTTGWGADPWGRDVMAYMEECNRRCSVIPQCETKEALDQIEAITALPGVDGIFVGPFDLSIALDIPLEFDHPLLLKGIDRILAACQKEGKQSYIFAGTMKDAVKWARKGFDHVAYGLDTSTLINAYQKDVQDFHCSLSHNE